MRGQSFNAFSLSQGASKNLDSSPTPAHWTNVANTILSGSGPLTITVRGGTGSCSTTLPVADAALLGASFSGVSFAGYRYLDIQISADVDAQAFRISIGGKTWSQDYKGNPLLAGTSPQHIRIDLCGPSSNTTAVDTWDSKWTYASVGPVVITDGPLSGVSNVTSLSLEHLSYDILGGDRVYTLSSLSLISVLPPKMTVLPAFNCWVITVPIVHSGTGGTVTTTTYARRFLQGDTDGRQSLEVEDVTWIHTDNGGSPPAIGDTYSEATIDSMATALSGSSSAYPTDGFTVTRLAPSPDGSGNFSPDYLNKNLPAVFVQGAGAAYVGNAWHYGFDLDISSAVTLPAQLLLDQIEWYPGCGDVLQLAGGASSGALELRAAAILRGQSWGLIFNKANVPLFRTEIDLKQVTGNVLVGKGVSKRNGEYFTGLPYGKGSLSHTITAHGMGSPSTTVTLCSRKRQRVGFGVALTCCQTMFCSDHFFFPFASQAGDHTRLPLEDWRQIPDAAPEEEEQADTQKIPVTAGGDR